MIQKSENLLAYLTVWGVIQFTMHPGKQYPRPAIAGDAMAKERYCYLHLLPVYSQFCHPICKIPDWLLQSNYLITKGERVVHFCLTSAAALLFYFYFRYKEKVKELSSIYHDRPVPPGKEIRHWVKHVIRTHGAPHLRSPALHVPFYQKLYLDLLAIIVLFVLVIRKIGKYLYNLRYCAKMENNKKNK